MQEWIDEELQGVDLGDKRLNKRFAILLDRLSAKPNVSIPAACKGLGETIAAYRFFSNGEVSSPKLLAPHADATSRRIAEHNVVLIAQDTTELEWTRRQEKVGGPLSGEDHVGAYAHICLALTPDRVPLGVVRADIWTRDPDSFRKRKECSKKPIEEKESFRWLEGYRTSSELAGQCPDTQVVCLSDSEGDIYECFDEAVGDEVPLQGESEISNARSRRADWIVRACQDRRVDSDQGQKLYEVLGQADTVKQAVVEVSARQAKGDKSRRKQSRKARQAEVTIRAACVKLQPPPRRGPSPRKLRAVHVNAVLVREESPPEGTVPIEWMLLTNLPIDHAKAVERVIDYYCCRWEIEIFFRTLKSGCQVEELQLETSERMVACMSVYLIVAWRVMYLLMLGRKCPEIPCDVVLEDSEWRSVYHLVRGKNPPKTAPSLGEAIVMIASLGGYLNRKNDRPGPKAMWIGIQRMRDFAQAWITFGPGKPTYV